MEMTFPHPVSHREGANRQSHRTMLAMAIARQANSETVRAVLRAARRAANVESAGDAIEQRIHYFGSHPQSTLGPSGAFWATHRSQDTGQAYCKNGVYQDASRNSKAHDVDGDRTGEQFNQAGHGASRTL